MEISEYWVGFNAFHTVEIRSLEKNVARNGWRWEIDWLLSVLQLNDLISEKGMVLVSFECLAVTIDLTKIYDSKFTVPFTYIQVIQSKRKVFRSSL